MIVSVSPWNRESLQILGGPATSSMVIINLILFIRSSLVPFRPLKFLLRTSNQAKRFHFGNDITLIRTFMAICASMIDFFANRMV